MFTIRQFQHFAAVAKLGSFRKAAASLGLAQSTLSRSIQELEEVLAVRLFERDQRSVQITPEGRKSLELAENMLRKVDEVRARFKEIRGGQGQVLRVGVGVLVAQTWIGRALRQFSHVHPGVGVELDEVRWWELVDALRSGRYELIIGEFGDAEKADDIAIKRLPQRPACLVVRKGHKLALQTSVTAEDISKFANVGPRLPAPRLTGFPAESSMGRISDDGRFFLPQIECTQLRTMLEVVAGSNAFCATFPQIVGPQLQDGSLVVLPFKPNWLHTRYAIMHMRQKSGTTVIANAFSQAAIAAEREYFGVLRAV